jgi:phenylacetic acid degradation operon negative regulatory protein
MRLIYDYRHFPFRDPDLPPGLLPADWSGRRAHAVFLEAHELLRAPAERAVDALIG